MNISELVLIVGSVAVSVWIPLLIPLSLSAIANWQEKKASQ